MLKATIAVSEKANTIFIERILMLIQPNTKIYHDY